MNNYEIYLVNRSGKEQTFWLFSDKPKELDTSEVYANSNYSIRVRNYKKGRKIKDVFEISKQYGIIASASTKAVKSGTRISSSNSEEVELGQTWKASYEAPEKKMGPLLEKLNNKRKKKNVVVKVNKFDQSKEGPNGWYSNMSFGVTSEGKYVGTSWSPLPQKKYTITPKMQFYVTVGEFESDKLADINTVSSEAATISEDDFNDELKTTVELLPNGDWKVRKGPPKFEKDEIRSTSVNSLLLSHRNLTLAHKNLTELVKRSMESDIRSSSLSSDEEPFKFESEGVSDIRVSRIRSSNLEDQDPRLRFVGKFVMKVAENVIKEIAQRTYRWVFRGGDENERSNAPLRAEIEEVAEDDEQMMLVVEVEAKNEAEAEDIIRENFDEGIMIAE